MYIIDEQFFFPYFYDINVNNLIDILKCCKYYRKVSNIRRTKSRNLNVSRYIL